MYNFSSDFGNKTKNSSKKRFITIFNPLLLNKLPIKNFWFVQFYCLIAFSELKSFWSFFQNWKPTVDHTIYLKQNEVETSSRKLERALNPFLTIFQGHNQSNSLRTPRLWDPRLCRRQEVNIVVESLFQFKICKL